MATLPSWLKEMLSGTLLSQASGRVRSWLLCVPRWLASLWCFLQKNRTIGGVVDGLLSITIVLEIISSYKAFTVLPVERHPGGRLERQWHVVPSSLWWCPVFLFLCPLHYQVITGSSENLGSDSFFQIVLVPMLVGKQILYIASF